MTAFGAYLRFDRLSIPRSIVFDETYYVKDAFGILRYGVEHNLVGGNTDAMVAHGQTHIFSGGGEFVVHPPIGKVLIAAGEGCSASIRSDGGSPSRSSGRFPSCCSPASPGG